MNCKRCGDDIEYSGRGPPPKYCKSCAYTVGLIYDKKRMQMIRKQSEELGTRNFGKHMKTNADGTPNFSAEARAVRKELRELGLRKHGNSKTIEK